MSDFGTPQFPPPQFPTAPQPPVPPGRTGPPWEGTGPAVQRFVDTAKGALTDPVATFSNMRREGGLAAPLLYYLIGMLIGVIGSSLWQFVGFGMPGGFGGGYGGYGAVGAGFGIGMALIVTPILATIGMFIGAAIIHFALGLFGGQKFPFETTFRTMAYSFGSAYPIAILPFCGGFIAAIWGLITAIIGLAQTQETTTGKSAAAVLTPTVLCCALWIFFFAAMMALIMGGAAAGSFGR